MTKKKKVITPLTDDPKLALEVAAEALGSDIEGQEIIIPLLDVKGNRFKAKKKTDWYIKYSNITIINGSESAKEIVVFSKSCTEGSNRKPTLYPLFDKWGKTYHVPTHRYAKTVWYPFPHTTEDGQLMEEFLGLGFPIEEIQLTMTIKRVTPFG